MKVRFLILSIIFYLFSPKLFAAIDIVYPAANKLTINSNETFFTGNVNENSSLTINNVPVKLYENTYFIQMVPLNYGINNIIIKSDNDEKKYVITRPKLQAKQQIQDNQYTPINQPYKKSDSGFFYAKTSESRSTLRDKPSTSGNRLIELPKDINLYLDGYKNDYYHLAVSDSDLWIHKSNLSDLSKTDGIKLSHLKKHRHDEDKEYYYEKFYLSHTVPYTIKTENNTIKLTLYNIDNANTSNNSYEFSVSPEIILAYDCIAQDNVITLRYAKRPKIQSKFNPLKGVRIFVDAGHGGSETGTISPERLYEKDINLYIAKTLINLLQAEGAEVIFSRIDDSKVDLYKRVDIAKENKALISVSIHVNSLPYGKNPYVKHGCEVHYYNDNAKDLAKIIQTNLSNDLNIKSNGIIKSSFALTRSTNPVSVLVETAYMINPDEYKMLKNPVNQRNIAKSIRNSLEEYVISISKKD